MIQSVYGKDALARLDEDEEDEDTSSCIVHVKPVELIELDELIIGALNEKSFDFAQQGKTKTG